MQTATDAFKALWDAGYRRLVPIIPPDAEISERSSLYRRVGTSQDGRGKTPGVRGHDGKWYGFDWVPHEADEEDIRRWQAMGAGTGIKTGALGDGRALVLIDADTLDEDFAKTILAAVRRHCGELPIRVGRYPKAGYPVRVAGEFRYARVAFGELDERGQPKDRVEILSDGRQFVAHGVHPATRKPYRWFKPLPPIDELPVVEPRQLEALLAELRDALPNASDKIAREGSDAHVAQEALRGSLEHVRRAVAAIPNTSEHFPTRESYRDMGYAIKAALPDHPDEAFEIFADWCARWQDGHNDPEVVAADWSRMKPPYRRGAGWLYELAERFAPERFNTVDIWFQPITEDNPFAEALAQANVEERPAIRWVDPGEWEATEPPPREWEVEGWIPRGEVTLVRGDGGIGKTLLMHQYATAAAAGRDWLGLKTRKARVMCFFCEDSEDELHRRQRDINAALGISFAEIRDTLRIASRKHEDNFFVLWDRQTGALKRQPVWEQLVADAKAFRADVVIVDTIADVFAGSEIDRMQVNAFVKSCLGRLAQEIGGSVIALGHPSMAGKQSGEGESGSTAWSNAVRSRLYLKYPKGVESGDVRELENRKLNYGPKGSRLKLRWKAGAFEVIAGSSAIASEFLPNAFYSERGVSDIERATDAAVLEALLDAGPVPMSLKERAGNYAPRILKRWDRKGLEPYDVEEVHAALERLLRAGVIREGEVGRKPNRHPALGFVVVRRPDAPGGPGEGSVFE